MFLKKDKTEIILSRANMVAFSLAQEAIECLWQNQRPKILQTTIFSSKISDESGPVYGYEVRMSVDHHGAVVEIEVSFDLYLSQSHSRSDRNEWSPVNFFDLRILSLPKIKGLKISLDIGAVWTEKPMRFDSRSEKDIRAIWCELGLKPNQVVPTIFSAK